MRLAVSATAILGMALVLLAHLSSRPSPISVTIRSAQPSALPASSGHTPTPAPTPPRLRASPPPQPPLPPRLFDLDSPAGVVSAVATVARNGELILYTSDWNGIGSAINLVRQLALWSLDERALLLADKRTTCTRAIAQWPRIYCGWSGGIPGFERYASSGDVELWGLWSAKWLVLARLVERGANVMMTDSDVLLLGDPYPLLQSDPLGRFALLLPPEGARVNVGWLYARGRNASGGLPSLLWDMVRRLRLFLEQVTLTDRLGAPSVQGLWDQGLFSDALTSAVTAEHSYAFTYADMRTHAHSHIRTHACIQCMSPRSTHTLSRICPDGLGPPSYVPVLASLAPPRISPRASHLSPLPSLTRTHTRTHARTHTHTHTHTHSRAHTRARTRTHTNTHAHTRARTHASSSICPQVACTPPSNTPLSPHPNRFRWLALPE